ncbi:MAG: prepilin-type N-terminal cleavage/methylation domain-containing protein [Acidiferrobacterales bacterium]
MSHRKESLRPGSRRASGFTLVELIMIIVLLAVLAVPLLGSFGQVSRSLGTDAALQSGQQLDRECGEFLLAQRRDNPAVGYAGIDSSTSCAALPNLHGLNVSVTLQSPYSGPACPGTCKVADITVSQGTQTLDTSTLLLAQY